MWEFTALHPIQRTVYNGIANEGRALISFKKNPLELLHLIFVHDEKNQLLWMLLWLKTFMEPLFNFLWKHEFWFLLLQLFHVNLWKKNMKPCQMFSIFEAFHGELPQFNSVYSVFDILLWVILSSKRICFCIVCLCRWDSYLMAVYQISYFSSQSSELLCQYSCWDFLGSLCQKSGILITMHCYLFEPLWGPIISICFDEKKSMFIQLSVLKPPPIKCQLDNLSAGVITSCSS